MTKKFISDNPHLVAEWHPTKNRDLTPSDVTIGSKKMVWWKCEKGADHIWEARVDSRAKAGNGCPFCSGKRVSSGNSLQNLNPDLARQWHPTKNGDLTPSDVKTGSNKKVWWLCEKGHEWSAFIYSRTSGSGCPFCAGQKAHSENSLRAIYPHLAKQWHLEKNGKKTPDNVTAKSDVKAWWICEKGHPAYQTKIYNRAMGKGCPVCSMETRTSFPEQVIFYYIKKHFPDAINGYKYDEKWEIDVYIPNANLGIEYDGIHYHQGNEDRDAEKDNYLKTANVFLLRVKEIDIRDSKSKCFIDDNIIYISKNPTITQLGEMVEFCYEYTRKVTSKNISIDVDIERDRAKIYSLYIKGVKQGSLFAKFSEIAKEWHNTKNLNVKPDMVAPSSNKNVWWLCGECSYEWKATIVNRTKRGSGCPVCANRATLKGYNDLATTHPSLSKQWNFIKNNDSTPSDVVAGSPQKVWWKCECGHEWLASIASRVKGNGCPPCGYKNSAKKYVSTLINKNGTFAENHPSIAKEWHPTMNGDLTPNDVVSGKSGKIWWQCKKHENHAWETTISERVRGSGCPICANRKVLKGYNDLTTTNPELSKEWHPTKNAGLSPDEFVAGAGKSVWWKCGCGHEWEATIVKRNMGRGCPECRNKKNRI